MRLSELKKEIDKYIEAKGDLEVCTFQELNGHYEEVEGISSEVYANGEPFAVVGWKDD